MIARFLLLLPVLFVSGCCLCKKHECAPPPTPSPKAPIPCPDTKPCPGYGLNKEIMRLSTGRIRAFQYNPEGIPSQSLLRDDLTFHSSGGLPDAPCLSSASRQILREALCHENGPSEVSPCYIPRHVFVFYSENDEIRGFFEVCFECNRAKFVSQESKIESVRLDFELLSNLVSSLGADVVKVEAAKDAMLQEDAVY